MKTYEHSGPVDGLVSRGLPETATDDDLIAAVLLSDGELGEHVLDFAPGATGSHEEAHRREYDRAYYGDDACIRHGCCGRAVWRGLCVRHATQALYRVGRGDVTWGELVYSHRAKPTEADPPDSVMSRLDRYRSTWDAAHGA